MEFIDRIKQRQSFKKEYTRHSQDNVNQVYIVEAPSGIGKSKFISEISKNFPHLPIKIYQSIENDELAIFKNLVKELDKASNEYSYYGFQEFYNKKNSTSKAIHIFLKITAVFGQVYLKNKNKNVELTSMIKNPVQYESFILKAQTENLFEYAKYVFSKEHLNIIFHQASEIDSSSLDLISKLIIKSNGCVFIFECNSIEDSLHIENTLQNAHKVFVKTYHLEKLSEKYIWTYIERLLKNLKINKDNIDLHVLDESISKGDLSQILSVLKDFNHRLEENMFAKLRSTEELLTSIRKEQLIFLILIYYSKGKLSFEEQIEIIHDLNITFEESDLSILYDKNLLENREEYIVLPTFVLQVLSQKFLSGHLKYVTTSCLVRSMNNKLSSGYNSRYVDVLTEYYLSENQLIQLKSILHHIHKRLLCFNTQSERIYYFNKFHIIRDKICNNDIQLTISFVKISYDSNLYYEAWDFIQSLPDKTESIIFAKALILNRCEQFEKSRKYITLQINGLNETSSLYFNLSLIQIMNLIQLEKRPEAKLIFDKLVWKKKEKLYPYLIRLSNVFYKDYFKRLAVVESITEQIYRDSNSEFSGLHSIYLGYLYSMTHQPELAENALSNARIYFGKKLIYNHMILHNEATIKFHNQEIDEEILILLNNAKLTAYDEYDIFAINNNILAYYISTENIASIECQELVMELEEKLKHTHFKRFINIINFNIYRYYTMMYKNKESNYYKAKLTKEFLNSNEKYKLMYETSWKLPLEIEI